MTQPDVTTRFRADFLAGLGLPRKRVPPRYFYDAAGSALFDEITELPEYYPTRTEVKILTRHAGDMADRLGPGCLLVEFGGGSLAKVGLLLDRLESPAGLVPVDVSCGHLKKAAAALAAKYPGLPVVPVCADFTADVELPPLPAARRAVFFPGSTLGNFGPADADALLRRVARVVGPGGGLLLGIDLRKDPAVIEAAYNDAAGVTAAFNLNLLVRANRELGASFDLRQFRHRAYYNADAGRVEMHLESLADQTVQVGEAAVRFRRGETIHTEDSYKYDLAEFPRRAARCGLRVDATWTDGQQYFGVLYLTATP